MCVPLKNKCSTHATLHCYICTFACTVWTNFKQLDYHNSHHAALVLRDIHYDSMCKDGMYACLQASSNEQLKPCVASKQDTIQVVRLGRSVTHSTYLPASLAVTAQARTIMTVKPHDRRCGAFDSPCDCDITRWQLLVLLSNGVHSPAAGTVGEIFTTADTDRAF